MDFTFYNSYDILELVPRRVIFWTKLNCCPKGSKMHSRIDNPEKLATVGTQDTRRRQKTATKNTAQHRKLKR
jgi:hypothetical protein